MKLLILPDDKFMLQSGTAPTIGREYILEDALEGTGAQNRTGHGMHWRKSTGHRGCTHTTPKPLRNLEIY